MASWIKVNNDSVVNSCLGLVGCEGIFHIGIIF